MQKAVSGFYFSAHVDILSCHTIFVPHTHTCSVVKNEKKHWCHCWNSFSMERALFSSSQWWHRLSLSLQQVIPLMLFTMLRWMLLLYICLLIFKRKLRSMCRAVCFDGMDKAKKNLTKRRKMRGVCTLYMVINWLFSLRQFNHKKHAVANFLSTKWREIHLDSLCQWCFAHSRKMSRCDFCNTAEWNCSFSSYASLFFPIRESSQSQFVATLFYCIVVAVFLGDVLLSLTLRN